MRNFLLLLLVIFGLGGCGGSSVAGTEPTAIPATQVLGRVQLDVPMAGAQVQLFTLAGAPIATREPVVTEADGVFRANLLEPVSSLRAVATAEVGGATETCASEYPTFAAGSEMVKITPLTNIVSAYHDAHPELSLEQCEKNVARYLQLPAGHTIRHHQVTGHRPGFHVGRYLAAARNDNGFLARVVQSVDQQSPTVPNGIFVDETSTYWMNEGIQLGVAVIGTVLQADGIPAGALIGWAVDLALGVGEGSSSSNFAALASEIQQLERKLTEGLSEIEQAVNNGAYFNQLSAAVENIPDVTDYQQALQALLNEGQSPIDIVTEVTTPPFTGILDQCQEAQMGAAGGKGLLDQLADVVGFTQGYYSNPGHFDKMMTEFSFFAGRQTGAIDLMVEGYHAKEPPDPAQALFLYDEYCQNLSFQASALPQPLDSDNVLLVQPAGLLFYRVAFTRATFQDAKNLASIFQEGGYKNWRVASRGDILALLNPNSVPGFSNSVQTLQAAGLDFSRIVDAPYRVGVNAGSEGASFFLDQGTDGFDGDAWGDDHFSFLLVCQVIDQDPSLYPALAPVDPSTLMLTQEGDRLHATVLYKLVTEWAIDDDNGREVYLYAPEFPPETAQQISNASTRVDITNLIAWSSSDTTTLRVQNAPASKSATLLASTPPVPLGPGAITWLKSGTVTVTAQFFNLIGVQRALVQAPITLTNNNVPAPTLQSIRLGPKKNNLLTTAPSVTPMSLFGFYSDGTSKPLNSATFTASVPQAQVVLVGTDIELNLSANPGVTSFTVTATVDGKTDTARFPVDIP